MCADPEPQFGGDQCLGADVEMEEGCQVGGLCPSKILLRPVHCTQILLLFGYFIFDFLFLAFFKSMGAGPLGVVGKPASVPETGLGFEFVPETAPTPYHREKTGSTARGQTRNRSSAIMQQEAHNVQVINYLCA